MCNNAYLYGKIEMKLHFTDGITIDTSGSLRKLQLEDGWYVVGEGFLIPMASEDKAEETIVKMTAPEKIHGHEED